MPSERFFSSGAFMLKNMFKNQEFAKKDAFSLKNY
jgi:hypothetical protein